MYSFGKKWIKLVPTNTAGSWFQCVRWEIGSNKYSGIKQQQGIGSNQYGAKLISTNTAGNILRETVPTKMAGHSFQSIRREIGSNQYSGEKKTGNWFQPIRRENLCEIVPTNTACF
jgi:hypothetical protein